MNERIIELARQSGGIDMTNHVAGGVTCWLGTGTPEFLEKFSELVRADECEACAKVCDGLHIPEEGEYHWIPDGRGALQQASELIRARGNHD